MNAAAILAILKLVLGIADSIARKLGNDQLEEAGAAILASSNLQRASNAKREADAIRERVKSGELSDPFLRP